MDRAQTTKGINILLKERDWGKEDYTTLCGKVWAEGESWGGWEGGGGDY